MTDHSDIDGLTANLPAFRPPPNDAPILVRLWWAVRTLWSRVHIRRWRTVRDTGVNVYQENMYTGERRVRTGPRGSGYQPIAKDWMAGNRKLAALDATTARLWVQIEELRDRKNLTHSLTAMVNDAKATPIPALDDLAAAIQADRDATPQQILARAKRTNAALRHRLLTDPPTVSAADIFADLGIDPDPLVDEWAEFKDACDRVSGSCDGVLSSVRAYRKTPWGRR